jgi:lipoate-protein ligase A
MTTLAAATGRRPTFEEVAAALREAFEAEHGLTLAPGGLTEEETARVERLVHERYGRQAFLTAPA